MFVVYFKTPDHTFRCYDFESKEFKTVNIIPQKSNFYLPKSYEKIDDSLIIYSDVLFKDSKEISPDLKYDYIAPYKKDNGDYIYRNHGQNIETFFKMHQSRDYKLAYFQPINPIECEWSGKCNNGGILHTLKGEYTVFGYDMKRFYQNCMKSDKFIFPYKEGKLMNYKKMPTNIPLGYYLVKISSENELFNIIFAKSKDDVYTSYSLKFCLKYQKLFNIQIELYDCPSNAYVYTLKKACISGSDVFTIWSDKIDMVKSKFPKNSLIKMLSSSLHGQLCRSLKFHKKIEQVDELIENGYTVGISNDNDYKIISETPLDNNDILFKLIKPNNRRFYNISRMQSFLIDYARIKMAEIIVDLHLTQNLMHTEIIRIQTDSIMTSRDFNYSKYPDMMPDDKITGKFIFNQINRKLIRI